MKCFFRLFVALFLFNCSANLATAQNEVKISVQGILRDMNGTPVDDGEQELVFRLYDQPTGGTALWADTAVVEISGGVYSYNLGSDVPLDPAQFSSTLYVGVSVEGFELEPRTELTYAPYTLYASSATHADTVAFAHSTPALSSATPQSDSLEVEEELRMVRGVVSISGYVNAGTGFTVSKTGTGQYEIIFDVPFSDTPAVYAISKYVQQNFAYLNRTMNIKDLSPSSVELNSFDCSSPYSCKKDAEFQFIAIGPK
ncbi:hypothetical protein [Phaeodactylibacter luteus]|uniref:Carboxypeptidase regulatory-like domain-containing protein n=1 Tax=Phaeodactylibacter luteus TaxID=1564516 RepID=A0A5C6RIA1_9BACT|nr:hypothetical protein [Phaeodactylibacter luteus]TXB61645.1 hypothetical protein FRY97_18150 [Phaeodactylibacter luteus]